MFDTGDHVDQNTSDIQLYFQNATIKIINKAEKTDSLQLPVIIKKKKRKRSEERVDLAFKTDFTY